MPENETECLVEKNFLLENEKQIGDKITLDVEKQTNDEGEEIEYLKQKELTITRNCSKPFIYIK